MTQTLKLVIGVRHATDMGCLPMAHAFSEWFALSDWDDVVAAWEDFKAQGTDAIAAAALHAYDLWRTLESEAKAQRQKYESLTRAFQLGQQLKKDQEAKHG